MTGQCLANQTDGAQVEFGGGHGMVQPTSIT